MQQSTLDSFSNNPKRKQEPATNRTPSSKKLKREASVEEAKFIQTPSTEEQSRCIQNPQKTIPKSAYRKPISDKHYDIIDDAPFYENQDVPFSFLVNGLLEIEKCHGENSIEAKREIISNMLRSIIALNYSSLADAFFFFICKLDSDYKGIKIGIGDSSIIKSISKACGRDEKFIKEDLNTCGDLGTVVANSKLNISTISSFFVKKEKKVLTLKEVMATLRKIANTHGQSSNNDKGSMLIKLILDSEKNESKYIIRFIQGNLKTGAAEKTYLSGIAKAITLTPPNITPIIKSIKEKISLGDVDKMANFAEKNINQAICEYPDYEGLIDALYKIKGKTESLKEYCHIRTGIPVKPMLAKPTKGIQIILKRFNNVKFTCEYKYDGFRGQVHYSKGNFTKIFSRNLDDMSAIYPEVVEYFNTHSFPNVDQFIIDSEMVPFNRITNLILPFQILSTRDKKDVKKEDVEINVCLFVFDILSLNNQALISKELTERRNILKSHIVEDKGKLQFVTYKDILDNNDEVMQGLLKESIMNSCEGLMVKSLGADSTYDPAKRTFKWLKLKKDYIEDNGIGDSLDLVIVGAIKGVGKRTGLYGSILLASYDSDTDSYQTISKTGTGFSDEELKEIVNRTQELKLEKPPHNLMCKDDDMDMWFTPTIVCEIKAADFTLSPRYTVGLSSINESKEGIGIRFPRFIRFRDDKKSKEATKSRQIVEMYRSQSAVSNDIKIEDDEDYY